MTRAIPVILAISTAVLAMTGSVRGQLFTLGKDEMIKWTSENPYERFPDGRPKVPDWLVERARGLSAEEVLAVLPGKNYRNQFANGFQVLHPGQKRRPEVEADPRVIIDQPRDPPVRTEDPRHRVRSVALRRDSLVPVVKRSRTRLTLNGVKIRIFTRWLVKMTVYGHIDTRCSLKGIASDPRIFLELCNGVHSSSL